MSRKSCLHRDTLAQAGIFGPEAAQCIEARRVGRRNRRAVKYGGMLNYTNPYKTAAGAYTNIAGLPRWSERTEA